MVFGCFLEVFYRFMEVFHVLMFCIGFPNDLWVLSVFYDLIQVKGLDLKKNKNSFSPSLENWGAAPSIEKERPCPRARASKKRS